MLPRWVDTREWLLCQAVYPERGAKFLGSVTEQNGSEGGYKKKALYSP